MSFIQLLEDTTLFTGGISAQQVANLRNAMLTDGKIDSPEADYLFILKEKFSGKENDPEWAIFWVEALLLFLQNEDNSLNPTRLTYVKNRISANGIDEMEQAFLNSLPQDLV